MDTVTSYFVLLIARNCAALWRVLSLFSYFIFLFCLQTSEAHSSFWNCFIFPSLFPFPSVRSKRIVLQIIVVLHLFYLLLLYLLLLPTSGKKRVAVLTRKCKCPYQHSAFKRRYNKQNCAWFDNVPLNSLTISIIILSYSGVVW